MSKSEVAQLAGFSSVEDLDEYVESLPNDSVEYVLEIQGMSTMKLSINKSSFSLINLKNKQ